LIFGSAGLKATVSKITETYLWFAQTTKILIHIHAQNVVYLYEKILLEEKHKDIRENNALLAAKRKLGKRRG
jgi:hypothetical protein